MSIFGQDMNSSQQEIQALLRNLSQIGLTDSIQHVGSLALLIAKRIKEAQENQQNPDCQSQERLDEWMSQFQEISQPAGAIELAQPVGMVPPQSVGTALTIDEIYLANTLSVYAVGRSLSYLQPQPVAAQLPAASPLQLTSSPTALHLTGTTQPQLASQDQTFLLESTSLQLRGSDAQLQAPFGQLIRSYASEGFVIHERSDGNHSQFEVTTASGEDLFSFQSNPDSGQLEILRQSPEFEDNFRLQFLQAIAVYAERESSGIELKGIDKLQQDIQQLGDMAPKGSRAILTAHLATQQQPVQVGQQYVFERAEGNISIYRRSQWDAQQSSSSPNRPTPLYQLSKDGNLMAGGTLEDQKAFGQMYDRLSQSGVNLAQTQSRQGVAKSPSVKSVQLERA